MDKLHRIGKYKVIPAVLGDGGFCCVFPCEYSSGSKKVAVKISLVPLEDCSHDMKWISHKREWQMYQTLAFGRTKESQSSGIPAVFECGFVQTLLGTHIWMSMQLLGPDLRKLSASGQARRSDNFEQYATGMLTALQHVHKHGIVHKDIKPANFCLGGKSTCYSEKVYIVDFGLAALAPDQERNAQDSTYKYTNFEGTPDYASTDHLRGLRCSAKDDLESLGYTFLEMMTGDLPWDLTSGLGYDDGDYFSKQQLSDMAARREVQWEQLCRDGHIPSFLMNWHSYVRSLKPSDIPSYAWLFHILHHSRDSPGKRPRDLDHTAEQANLKAKRLRVEELCAAEE